MKKKLRLLYVFLLAADLAVLGVMVGKYFDEGIPDSLLAVVGELETVELPFGVEPEESREVLQVTNKSSGFSMVSDKTGNYHIPVKLFGIFHVKDMDVKVIQKMKLAPSGEPIGIYVETNGLLVLDTAEIEGKDGLTYAPGENLLKSGDYILKWNDKVVPTIQKLNQEIQSTKDKKVPVIIRRGKERIELAVKPILAADGTYKIGTWVREDTQGIGTLTYVTEDGKFGTLGHGITDVDTGTLLNLNGGELYRTKIMGITKGLSGKPGELQGYMNMVAENQIGEVYKNTNLGVFGTMNKEQADEYGKNFLPVGRKQEIKKGKATIYTNLGHGVGEYEIEIEKILINSKDNKSMEICVTDKELLKQSGGIVQGMSGSPIIQNGKIIGAVTHVLVDDPTRGYGIFIENMLSQ